MSDYQSHLKSVLRVVFKQGYDAYDEGIALLENPYIYAKYEVSDCEMKKPKWSEGWRKAEKEGITLMSTFRWHNYSSRKWRGKSLTHNEADILFLLHVHSDRLVSLENLILFLYPDPDKEPDHSFNCVAIFITKLRKKFGQDIIKNTHGQGYYINS